LQLEDISSNVKQQQYLVINLSTDRNDQS